MKVEYHNSTGLLAVIGDPIAHSLSPLLQNTMIAELGMDDLYLAIQVPRGGLPDFLRAVKTIGIQGFNLTMPHKEDILPYLSDITWEARRAGSVNSVRLRDGKLEGHSTDGIGFRRSLLDLGYEFYGQTVTIIGAGGAAKSIAMTAVDSGAKQVRILNRTLERAIGLCAGEKKMEAFPMGRAEEALADSDIVVNTTPIGMEGIKNCGEFSFLRALKPGALAIDCIYAPAMTPFMLEAKKQRHPVANGIGMLVYQAVYAYAFFRQMTLEEDTVSKLGSLLLKVSGISPRG